MADEEAPKSPAPGSPAREKEEEETHTPVKREKPPSPSAAEEKNGRHDDHHDDEVDDEVDQDREEGKHQDERERERTPPPPSPVKVERPNNREDREEATEDRGQDNHDHANTNGGNDGGGGADVSPIKKKVKTSTTTTATAPPQPPSPEPQREPAAAPPPPPQAQPGASGRNSPPMAHEQPTTADSNPDDDFLDPHVKAQQALIATTEPRTPLEVALTAQRERSQAHVERLTHEIMKLKQFISKRKQTYKRKRKETGAPTRALSAYNIYVKERFKRLSRENEVALKSSDTDARLKRVPPASLVASTGNQWKGLTARDKVYYEEKAKADRARYEGEMANYQAPETKAGSRKRNKTGYNMFFSQHVIRMKQTESGVPSERGSVARMVGGAWKQLTPEEKQYYEREADMNNQENPVDGNNNHDSSARANGKDRDSGSPVTKRGRQPKDETVAAREAAAAPQAAAHAQAQAQAQKDAYYGKDGGYGKEGAPPPQYDYGPQGGPPPQYDYGPQGAAGAAAAAGQDPYMQYGGMYAGYGQGYGYGPPPAQGGPQGGGGQGQGGGQAGAPADPYGYGPPPHYAYGQHGYYAQEGSSPSGV